MKKNEFVYLTGLQYGTLCFCDNSFGNYGVKDDALCKSPCAGNPAQTCGGTYHNDIYRLGE